MSDAGGEARPTALGRELSRDERAELEQLRAEAGRLRTETAQLRSRSADTVTRRRIVFWGQPTGAVVILITVLLLVLLGLIELIGRPTAQPETLGHA